MEIFYLYNMNLSNYKDLLSWARTYKKNGLSSKNTFYSTSFKPNSTNAYATLFVPDLLEQPSKLCIYEAATLSPRSSDPSQREKAASASTKY